MRIHTEAKVIYHSVKESSPVPDVFSPFFHPIRFPDLTLLCSALAVWLFPFTLALVLFWSCTEIIQLPDTAEIHSPCGQETFLLAQQVELAQHKIR